MSINEAATIQTTSINAVTSTTGTLSIGDTQTTGVLNLGTGVRTSAGVMNIATGASNACSINIMNGNTTAGSINIANGTGASQTTSVNIGSGSTTGTVTIGGTSNTVQVNGTLAMGTGKNITLQPTAGYVAPTADTMLGGITTGSFLTPLTAFSANKDVATIDLVKGTYLVFFSFNSNYGTLPTRQYINFTGTALPLPAGNYSSGVITVGSINSFTAYVPISVTTAGTLVLTYNITGTVNSITATSYRAVRIA